MKEFKPLYSRFLAARPHELHFAAHSHHFWPDVTREAQLRAWDDAARLNDRKWEYIFQEIVPRVQGHIARLLNLKRPDMIALAPNTHDLLVRLFSELLTRPRLRLLTSDGEFHSFARQLRRYQEAHPHLSVTLLKADGLLHGRARFLADFKAQLPQHDVVFISQVFFNSGLALTSQELCELVQAADPETVFVIDGYHGFAALPTDLSALEGRVFYLGGGYKYAQGGEGVGFMVVPEGSWRPVVTGWFAEYAQLSAAGQGAVGYSRDGMAFWGATMDPSGWYRFDATWEQFQRLGVGVEDIHRHVCELQEAFLSARAALPGLTPLFAAGTPRGHFLTYEAASGPEATALRVRWQAQGVYLDQRGARLRLGFGPYHDLADVARLAQLLS